MKHLIIIVFTFFYLNGFAQYSERFKNLIEPLKKIETEIDTIFYSNGKPEFIIVRTNHQYNDEIVRTKFGTSHVFYRNGEVARKTQIDDYGNYINEKLFDRKGNLTEERITTKIDNRAKNISEYLSDLSFGDYDKTINYYRYSKRLDSWYKHKVEYLKLINSKGVEVRNYFDENGELLKTKSKDYRL